MTTTESGPSYRVRTDPRAADPRLRGRRYAIPFDRVWTEASRLVSGGMEGWGLTWQDDRTGILEARIPKRILRPATHVRVRVFLDADAQTGVQMAAGPVMGGRDLGASGRTIRAFFAALDDALDLRPGQLLPPSTTP